MARKIATTLAAGALLVAGGLAQAEAAVAAPAHILVYMNTTVTQWTHWTPDPYASTHAGTLYAGKNYFKCWTWGELYTIPGAGSRIWLLTDDDTGHRDVYVNTVYLDDNGFTHATEWLDQCN
ncbi:hypothetical protein [Streptomyces sp. NPDC005385]|uniref:hypothetical protein n=1 Tax=Streptomyces sp. NPDC005385 TaxID=3157039 RepID=UPI0033BC6DA4